MADIYGLDVSTMLGGDLDPYFNALTGPRAVGERLVRRLTTPRGFLSYAPDDGFDVRELLSRGLGPREVSELQSVIREEAEKEEAVLTASVLIAVLNGEAVRAQISLELSDGPYSLTLSIDKVTVEILEPGD